MIRPFKKQNTDDRNLEVVQANIAATLDPLVRLEILQGRLIKDVAMLSQSDTPVDHGLGRAHVGWIVVGKNSNAGIWEVSGTTPSKSVVLRADSAVTINLWIF